MTAYFEEWGSLHDLETDFFGLIVGQGIKEAAINRWITAASDQDWPSGWERYFKSARVGEDDHA
ncbi:MAG: hypothetical protein QMD53_04425 [Actinomycetota bacterium]|nr:hypothetical protein [Actinomycetota bacterium]